MEALRAANRGMARAVCQGAKTAKRYAALGAGMEVDAQGYGREPTAMVRGVLSCLFVCLFKHSTFPPFRPIKFLGSSTRFHGFHVSTSPHRTTLHTHKPHYPPYFHARISFPPSVSLHLHSLPLISLLIHFTHLLHTHITTISLQPLTLFNTPFSPISSYTQTSLSSKSPHLLLHSLYITPFPQQTIIYPYIPNNHAQHLIPSYSTTTIAPEIPPHATTLHLTSLPNLLSIAIPSTFTPYSKSPFTPFTTSSIE